MRSIFKRSHTKTTRHFLPHFLTKRTSLLEETNEFSSALSSCRSPGGSEARSKRSRVVTRCSSSPTPDLPYVFALYPTFLSFVCCSFCRCTFFRGGSPQRAAVKTDRTCDVSFSLSLMLLLSFALACERIETIVSYSLLMRCSLFSNALSRCNDNNNTIKQSSGPPPEKIVTLAGIIAPRMVRKFLVTFFTRSSSNIVLYRDEETDRTRTNRSRFNREKRYDAR